MDEAVKRYGEVVHHGNIHGEEVYSFTKNGFNILAHFHGEKLTVSCIAGSRVAN